MSELNNLLDRFEIPPVAKVHEIFDETKLDDPATEARKALENAGLDIKPGMRIAVTAGSRGIDAYVPILCEIISFLKSKGALPFVVPAMGSHGGATAEGQIKILEGFGITEERIGAPIVSSMETVQIGTTEKGLGAYIDKNAYEADGIMLFNRVKPHTAFRGRYESGIFKMLAIGLAKQKGAEATHFLRYTSMAENIERVGKLGIEKLNIVGAVATVENQLGKVRSVYACRKEDIPRLEPEWLNEARQNMPRIALDKIDVLIVRRIGKEISGAGMDTNIIGRYHSKAAHGGPDITMIGLLGVTEQSHGNGVGLGMADFIPKKMFEGLDLSSMYINSLTNTEPNCTKIPMILDDEHRVFQACIKLCGVIDPKDIKLVIIPDTKHLDYVWMSEAAVKNANAPIKVTGSYEAVTFDRGGELVLE